MERLPGIFNEYLCGTNGGSPRCQPGGCIFEAFERAGLALPRAGLHTDGLMASAAVVAGSDCLDLLPTALMDSGLRRVRLVVVPITEAVPIYAVALSGARGAANAGVEIGYIESWLSCHGCPLFTQPYSSNRSSADRHPCNLTDRKALTGRPLLSARGRRIRIRADGPTLRRTLCVID